MSPRHTVTPKGRTLPSLGLLLLLSVGGCFSFAPRFDDSLTARTPADLPAVPSGPSLGVLVLGDFGTGDEGQVEIAGAIARTHSAEPPDLVLTVGDNFYPSGVESVSDPLWRRVFEEVYSGEFWEGLVFFPTLGNHDVDGDERAQFLYSEKSPRWSMPGHYYTFQRTLSSGGTVRFLALDTNILEQRDSRAFAQVQWIDSILAGPGDEWVVAYGHHPMATEGRHGPNQEVREYLAPRFRGRVPLFLSGHNHSTELIEVSPDVLQGVCGGGAGLDNAYRVEVAPETLSAFSNGGWCFLRFWPEAIAVDLYNRVGTLRFRHLIQRRKEGA